MLQVIGVLVMVGAAALALWALVRTLRDRPVILRQLLAGAVVEALLLVQVVAALVVQAGATGPPGTYWLYIGFVLLLLPVAALWAFAERTRWSSVVLLVASLSVVFMQWRAMTMWTGQ